MVREYKQLRLAGALAYVCAGNSTSVLPVPSPGPQAPKALSLGSLTPSPSSILNP